MKKVRKIFWLFILAIFVIGGISVLVQTIMNDAIATEMKDLDLSSANGSLVVAYDVEEGSYTNKYIPKELLAKKQEDVGYVLNLEFSSVGASYSGGHYVTGNAIDVQLVDCDTGEVVAENYFEPYFPMTISSDTKTVSVDSSVVTDWINHYYPEWPADKDVGHDWKDATCTEARTCSTCGKVDGEPLGHDYGDAGCEDAAQCSRCGEGGGEPVGHQVDEWTLDTSNFNYMEGSCSRCGQTASSETDWDLFVSVLPSRIWKLRDILKDDTFTSYTNSTPNVTFEIKDDFTAVMHTPEGDYSFTWELWQVSISDTYPDMLTIYYYAYDEDGNKYTMGYDEYDGMISFAFYAEEESLFFE